MTQVINVTVGTPQIISVITAPTIASTFTVAGGVGPASTVPGPKGDTGLTGADSTVAGPTGATGSTGATGATGAAGADSTVPGPKGETGAQGIQGLQGIQGATGSTGAAGPSNLTIGTTAPIPATGESALWLDTSGVTYAQLALVTGD